MLPKLIEISFILFLCNLIIDSVDIFMNNPLYKDNSLISSEYIKLKYNIKNMNILKCFSFKNFIGIIILRVLLTVLLLSDILFYNTESKIFSSTILILLILIELYIRIRNKIGLSASENLIIFSLVVYLFVKLNSNINYIHYISFYAITSYFLTGYNKILSPKWRSGIGLTNLMSTENYGKQGIYEYLKSNKDIAKYLSWGIIVFQLLFFIGVFDSRLMLLFVFFAFIFHLNVAMIMKLYNFLFIYLSTFPVLYYSSLKLRVLLISFI